MKEKQVAKRRRKNMYFTKVHEDAIIEYNNSTDPARREFLYETLIKSALSEMVDKIVFTYRFTSLPNIESLKVECKSELTTMLHKYKPEMGSKAFSYFSVITKNWFIHKVKQNSKKLRKEISLNDSEYAHLSESEEGLITEHEYHSKIEEEEFWTALWNEMAMWDVDTLKPNERKVLEAVTLILSKSEEIEIFNKKAIYLYLREITGLNTKQVVNNLNKLRAKYHSFKNDWNEGRL